MQKRVVGIQLESCSNSMVFSKCVYFIVRKDRLNVLLAEFKIMIYTLYAN